MRHNDQHPVYGDDCRESWLPDALCPEHREAWYGEKRMATEADAIRIATLGETIAERSRHALADSPNPSTTTVSLTVRELAILRATCTRTPLATPEELETLEGKLRRAALRLYDRGIR